MKQKMRLAFMVNSEYYVTHANLLIKSLRLTSDKWTNINILIMIPENNKNLKTFIKNRITDKYVDVEKFELDGYKDNFPFKDKAYAAAKAEELSYDFEQLIWLDCDTVFINEPDELNLEESFVFGYRPVDKKLIGSNWDEDIDDFWSNIYNELLVNEKDIFLVETSVDKQKIRAYFNAGLIVVKPYTNILKYWKENFRRLYLKENLFDYYKKSSLYAIFIHQAVLAGTVLSMIKNEEMKELNYLISYPLHLHSQYPDDKKPKSIKQLISCRYDDYFEKENLIDLRLDEPLNSLITQNAELLGMKWDYKI